MRIFLIFAKEAGWFLLWALIPALLLYPIALWTANHSHLSMEAVTQGYAITVALLFFPSGFLVDFLYRRFILKKTPNQRESSDQPSS